MRKGGGNAKGASFERKIAKALSLWVSDGKHEDLFWRTSQSGGRATTARSKGRSVRQSGDIGAVERGGHSFTEQWYVECKAYRKIDLDGFLIKNVGKVAKWWKLCRQEALHYERDPMLIVKQNGWPWLVITRHNHAAHWVQPILHHGRRQVDVTSFQHLLKAKYKAPRLYDLGDVQRLSGDR